MREGASSASVAVALVQTPQGVVEYAGTARIDGVPGTASGKLPFDAGPRAVVAVLNNESITARTWPLKDGHISIAEFLN